MTDSALICIVCDKEACRRFGTATYSEYYCKYHSPEDKRKKQEAERKMSNERRKLYEESKKDIEYMPRKIDQTPIKKEVKN